jgi:hypothetical protein
MSFDTPRKKNRREKLAKRFSEDWETEYKTNPIIRYKRKSGLSGLWQKFFGRKHSVFSMYCFFKYEYLNNKNAQKFYFSLDHDNIPVKGVPFKYELQGTWDIDDADLKYLYGGPLIDQHTELLVPADTRFNGFIRFIRFRQKITPTVALISAFIGVVVKLPSLMALL